ncbi:MAG: hypothetical protein J6S65_02920 [Bacteroidaceae bacterium]|nr:hypothetical protein [Bacteroidaceae bacterium]
MYQGKQSAKGTTDKLANGSVTPPWGFVIGHRLAGVPCFALHRLPMFFHAFGIFSGQQ